MSDGENIKTMRRKKGLTQDELGSLLGVGKSAISRWESGEREVTLATMRGIASALGVPLEYLIEGLDLPENTHSSDEEVDDRAPADVLSIGGDSSSGAVNEDNRNHIGGISETVESFADRSRIHLTIPHIDDPELISAFEGFKELDKLTPSDIEDIKAILKLAQQIIDKRKKR
jgi:transcriptional regulator with XRE-family HTH domain